MCLIGEAFGDSSDEVCGAVVNIRGKGNKIAIWTGNVNKKDDILHIGYVCMCVCLSVHCGVARTSAR